MSMTANLIVIVYQWQLWYVNANLIVSDSYGMSMTANLIVIVYQWQLWYVNDS